MATTEYRGYSIRQQKPFGPLRLLRWVEHGKFVITKDGGDAFGATFESVEDAKGAIDRTERSLEHYRQNRSD
jgi:hypothetical protein